LTSRTNSYNDYVEMLINVQIRHIRSFIAVAQEKSFAAAATRLHVSQPALSQTIIQLEENIGLRLFNRTTRTVSLTSVGEQVLARALNVDRAMHQFHAELRQLQATEMNELRVGFMIGTAVQYIPTMVREFERVRPDALLRLEEFDFSDPSAGLRNGAVDCGIIRPPIDVDDIDVVEIAREKCVACLPIGHRLAETQAVTLRDILDDPIIAAVTPGVWRDYWIASSHRNAKPAEVVFEASTVESELQAVASGKGISITCESTAKFYARPGVIFKTITDMPECVMALGHRCPPTKLVSDFVSVVKRVSSARQQSGV
jgi:DNA-binding transcriptional LysR family regulator